MIHLYLCLSNWFYFLQQIILKRFDGFVANKRTWDEYKNGFGFLGSEFWLGNDKIAYVTNQKQYELRIDIVSSNGSSFYIKYDKFRVSDEWSGYTLTSLGVYSGTAGKTCSHFSYANAVNGNKQSKQPLLETVPFLII